MVTVHLCICVSVYVNEPALHALHPLLGQLEPSYVPSKLLPRGAPSVPTPAPAHSPTVSTAWAVAAEGNDSLKLDTEAPQLHSLSLFRWKIRTFSSHVLCVLKSPVHEDEGVSSAVSGAWKSPEPDAPDPEGGGLETHAP